MLTSFSTALSSLSAHSTAVDIVGHNLANLNTNGFKASSVAFYDLVSQSFGSGGGETQVGFGVARPVTLRQFTQGAIQSSTGALDAAIQGDGFLMVRDAEGRTLYTRGGNLRVDRLGNLVTARGQQVLGWSATGSALATTGPVGGIVVPVGTLRPPVGSSEFTFDMNLNSAATSGPPADQFSTSIEVFDSLGVSHVVTATFTRSATAGQWDYSVAVPASDTTAAVAPLTGSVTFNSQGVMTSPAIADAPPVFNIAGLVSGAADMALTWNLFNGSVPRLTQFAQASAVSANLQNGSAPAQLTRVSLADGGRLVAQFSNGQQIAVGQLAMASIRNPESLVGVGDNAYQLSATTASPAVGLPGTGGRGAILGGSVEASTVDIAREFTNLIIFQRGYQASTRVITTVDEISQETINLKR